MSPLSDTKAPPGLHNTLCILKDEKGGLPLNEAFQLFMQDVRPVLHQPNIFGRAVHTLAVLDRSLEHVAELGFVPEEIWSDKVHHAPVLHQVVLQGIAG